MMLKGSDPCLHIVRLWSFVVYGLLVTQIVSASLSPEKARGIAPEDWKHYESNTIWCKDKSKSFSKAQLNDDFCDCLDGTDEPGTSACPEGKFYCENVGYSPQFLFSSRINDGICDCCDGSDEYNGKTKCPDTCWEAGKKSREKLEKKLETFKEGSRIRSKDIEHSKHLRKQQESELISLKKEEKSLKDTTHRLKVQLDAIEEAERLEREKRAKEEEERKAKEKDIINETLLDGSHEIPVEKSEEVDHITEEPEFKEDDLVDSRNNVDEKPNIEEDGEINPGKDEVNLADENHPSQGSGDLSKEELGRLVASRWTGEKVETDTKGEEKIETTNEENYDEETYSGDHAQNDGDEDETEDEDERNDSSEYESEIQAGVSDKVFEDRSWWQKLRQAPRTLLNILGLKRMHVDTSAAERIRSDYREANNKLNDLRSRISELETKLKQDFGKDGEFFSLYNQCFENRQNKYVYKVCVYKQSTQEEGHASTRLGSWDGFEDDYKSFQFSNGDHCWNGPQRSLKVNLKCGVKTQLSDVEEPSRCEYVVTLRTPAVCAEERVKELQAQLDAIYSVNHEEL